MSTNLWFAATVAAFGTWLLLGRTRSRAIERYTERAGERPHRLLDSYAPETALVAHRGLVGELVDEVVHGTGTDPVVIVGEAGTGKTTLLVELTRQVARAGRIPVPVPLRGQSSPDLVALARSRFLAAVDPELRSDADGDAIWRRLIRSGDIVVLADGLDELALEDRAQDTDARALAVYEEAAERGVKVVLTSRPLAIPEKHRASVFHLSGLSADEAHEYLRCRGVDDLEQWVERAIDDVDIDVGARPFFLDLIVDLHCGRARDSLRSAGEAPAPTRLLQTWEHALVEGYLAPQCAITASRRRRAVDTSAQIAMAVSAAGESTTTLDEVESRLGDLAMRPPSRGELHDAVDVAVALGIMHRHGPELRFRHALVQSYLTSVAIRQETCYWRRATVAGVSEELLAALPMAAAPALGEPATGQVAQAQALYDHVVEEAKASASDDAMALLTTAAGVASAVRLTVTSDLVPAFEGVWRECRTARKLRAIPALAALDTSDVHRFLWTVAHDREFPVRWAAARRLVTAPQLAYDALADDVEQLVAKAEEAAEHGHPFDHDFDVAVAGWVLPGLRRLDDRRLDYHVSRVLILALGPLEPLHVENSLGRGVKLAALLRPSPQPDPLALRLLKEARFWHARLSAVHAIALNGGGAAASQVLDRVVLAEHEHPFVREAARQAIDALRDGNDLRSVIWELEGEAVRHAAEPLTSRAARLLAETSVLLNLIYCNSGFEEHETPALHRVANDLPVCLGHSSDRRELFTGCPPACSFRLCPYPGVDNPLIARARISEAFCRRQRHIAQSVPRAAWQRRVRRRALVASWRQLETQVGRAFREEVL